MSKKEFTLLSTLGTQYYFDKYGKLVNEVVRRRRLYGGREYAKKIAPVVSTWREDLEDFLEEKKMDGYGRSAMQDLINLSIDKLQDYLDEEWTPYSYQAEDEKLRFEVADMNKESAQYERQRKTAREERAYERDRVLETMNPITYKWDPETVNLRQIEWLMARKRRIYKEKKINEFMFQYEMKQLAKLRKRELEKKAKS